MSEIGVGQFRNRPWPDPELDAVSPWPPPRPRRRVNKVMLASGLVGVSGLIFLVALGYFLSLP